MIDQQLDDAFADVLREGLISHVRRTQRRRRIVPVAAVTLVAVLVGGSIAYASRTPGQVGTPLARPVIETHVGSAVIPLPPPPNDATYLRIILSCMTPGRCQTAGGGIDGGDWATFDGPLMQAEALPLTNRTYEGNAQDLPPIDPADGLRVTADRDVVWRMYAVYVDHYESDWLTNDSAQTYGVPTDSGAPDLIATWTDGGEPGYTPTDLLLGANAEPRFRGAADVGSYSSSSPPEQRLPVFATDGETLMGYLTIT